MKMKRTLQAVAIMAATESCSSPTLLESALLLEVDGLGEELADLELFIGGDVFPGSDERRFTATDLLALADTLGLHWGVPDHGTATVTARIVEDDRVVAEGTGEWNLEPDCQWELFINRGLHDRIDDSADLECREFSGCHRKWRFPIAEDAANVEGEALWLFLQAWR